MAALPLLSASPFPDIFKEIENAISLGNAKMMEGYLNSSIELETPSTKGIYSRGQAQIILDKFFQKYPLFHLQLHKKETVQEVRALQSVIIIARVNVPLG